MKKFDWKEYLVLSAIGWGAWFLLPRKYRWWSFAISGAVWLLWEFEESQPGEVKTLIQSY